MAAHQDDCFFNKYGFCKYSDRCRKYHEKELCEKSDCEIRECSLRHPKMCKFFQDFGFCKFNEWCMFSHKTNNNNSVKNDELKKLEHKLKAVELDLENKNEKIVKLENEIKDIYLKVSEKDQTISKINNKLNALNEKIKVDFENSFENIEKKVENDDNDPLKTKTNDSASDIENEKVFECDICTYKTKSENGIKIHKAKKHTYTCKCCNRIFTDQDDYSKHTTECYSTNSYYNSPMSPVHRIPPRFPPRFPHGSPPRFPPTYPPRFPRSPMY